MGIPEVPIVAPPGSGIPVVVSNISPETEEPEVLPLLFSFKNYNVDECQVKTMDPKIARKALSAMRDIGMKISSTTDFSAKLPLLVIKNVDDEGDYASLYKDLRDSPDIQIQEAKIDHKTGRIFFYITQKILYMVAIRDSHYNTH